MTREEVVRMYIDWTTGADEEIKMSDWLAACYEIGVTSEEIEKEGTEILDSMF